jgi:transcriptional regulator with XRE-family HTH domain
MTRREESMGERIQRLREEARLTQDEAAERAGIPVGTLRHWEQGHTQPRLGQAVKLARILGVDMNTLTGFDEPAGGKPQRRGKR